jgi:hypothetical protein
VGNGKLLRIQSAMQTENQIKKEKNANFFDFSFFFLVLFNFSFVNKEKIEYGEKKIYLSY